MTARAPIYAPCSSSPGGAVPYNSASTCVPLHDGKLNPDGWTLDYETWQGVRTSDFSVGQWNTPDAYAGEVHDPMSQKPFMWNRNNANAYADPSGYDSLIMINPNSAFGLGHTKIVVFDSRTMRGVLYSAGPEHDGRFTDKLVVTKKVINDVRTLKKDYPTNSFYLVTATPQQDAATIKYLENEKSLADAGHLQYNAFSHNCAEIVCDAMRSAGENVSGQGAVPVLQKPGGGREIDPSALRPRDHDFGFAPADDSNNMRATLGW